MMPNDTSVHTEETSAPPDNAIPYRAYRASLCSEELTATEELYSELDTTTDKNRLDLLNKCRTMAWFVRSKADGHVHVASNSCRLRWCPMCSRGRSAYITHNLTPWLRTLKAARFLTLTLKHSNAPLSNQIEALYRGFRQLRRDRKFKKLCSGGIWFFQIKLNDSGEQWHPHLHCLITGKYIPQAWLSQLWLKLTQTSKIVDIRFVKNNNEVADYVSRYSARPAKLSKIPLFLRVEVFNALHGKRICGSWGTAKGVSLSPPRGVSSSEYDKLGSWSIVHELAKSDPIAKAIIYAWRSHKPIDANISCLATEHFIDNVPHLVEASVDKFLPALWDDY